MQNFHNEIFVVQQPAAAADISLVSKCSRSERGAIFIPVDISDIEQTRPAVLCSVAVVFSVAWH